MKVALVHDYLIQDGGAERVLLALHELYPDAPIFTLFYDAERSHAGFRKLDIRPSRLNRLPGAPRHYQWYLAFMPLAIERMDLSGFDLIISSASTFAKGIIVPPEAKHICYCHTPTRFLWQERHGYVNELPQPSVIKKILPPFLHWLRQWDEQAAQRPDVLITNSQTSRGRIRRYYRRESHVIYPPIDVENIPLSPHAGSYWLAGGRLVAYKRFDLILETFKKLGLPLKVFGDGPEMKKLRRLAGPKTEFLGIIDDAVKADLYAHAIGFLYPHIEDFGLTAVEAMAAGKPVLAYAKGGATETVIDGVTGQLMQEQSPEALAQAVRNFDPSRFDPVKIRAHAEKFSKQRFLQEIKAFVDAQL